MDNNSLAASFTLPTVTVSSLQTLFIFDGRNGKSKEVTSYIHFIWEHCTLAKENT